MTAMGLMILPKARVAQKKNRTMFPNLTNILIV